MSAENTASEVVQTILDNEKVAAVVAAGTAATGIISHLADVQTWLSIGATSIGILLSLILVIKHGIEAWKAWRDIDK